jgi:hypothetical protein
VNLGPTRFKEINKEVTQKTVAKIYTKLSCNQKAIDLQLKITPLINRDKHFLVLKKKLTIILLANGMFIPKEKLNGINEVVNNIVLIAFQ